MNIERLYSERRRLVYWVRNRFGIRYIDAVDEVQDFFAELVRRGEDFVRDNLFRGDEILWGRVINMLVQTWVNHNQTPRPKLIFADGERPVDGVTGHFMVWLGDRKLSKAERGLADWILSDGLSGKMPTSEATIVRLAHRLAPHRPYISKIKGGVLPGYQNEYQKHLKNKKK